eukprot:TRINITY_DN32064_c0_g1_i1.p1 TRINITY_DN32064_c0_g1~~TRINITY_DN32064_c0_g1_i1.p1  ORF type:complete len:730 (+),score=215.15 TRINITY_DN32064_c0_g1_i1:91-2280(+)
MATSEALGADVGGPELRDQESSVSRLKDGDEGRSAGSVHLSNFDLHIDGAQLLTGAELKLTAGRVYGLVGENGVGKTTLMRHLAAKRIKGVWAGKVTTLLVGYLDADPGQTVLEAVLQGSAARERWRGDVEKCEDAEEGDLADLYEQAEAADPSDFTARAHEVLHGVGVSSAQAKTVRVGELSGGWRVRVSLARALLLRPQLLLLDEPHCHLDPAGKAWLADQLRSYTGTVVITAHEAELLNGTATDVIHFSGRALRPYVGDYAQFVSTREAELAHRQRAAQEVDRRREHYEQEIARAQAKGGETGAIASRRKALERLGEERTVCGGRWKVSYMGSRRSLPPVVADTEVSFRLPSDKRIREKDEDEVILSLRGVGLSYPYERSQHNVLSGVSVSIHAGERIAVVGANGSGKTSLLRLIAGEVEPTQGTRSVHLPLMRVGYYKQDHVHSFDPEQTALGHLLQTCPRMTEEAARDHLGTFGVDVVQAGLKLGLLSSGQRARVALAEAVGDRPSILLLDEPSNHLDAGSVVALTDAVSAFKGCVVVVSHSATLIELCDTVLAVQPALREGDPAQVLAMQPEDFSRWQSRCVSGGLTRLQLGAGRPTAHSDPQQRQGGRRRGKGKKKAAEPEPAAAATPKAPAQPAAAKPAAKVGGGVKCRFCHGPHFTRDCAEKAERERRREEKQASKAAAQPSAPPPPAPGRLAVAGNRLLLHDSDGTWEVAGSQKALGRR